MAVRLATISSAAILLLAAPLAAQVPTPPPARADSDSPLITELPATLPAAPGESITAIENAVLATHDTFVAAIEALEFDHLAAMLASTNRGALIADGRVTLASDDMVERIRREFAPLRGVHHTFTRRHVALLSPTTALIVAEGTITAHTDDGASFTRPFAQSLVFMRIDDTWQLAHLHASAPPATLGR